MVQRTGDIEQDVREILLTRERMTQKIEMLKSRLRGAVRQTKYQVEHAIGDVKQTAEGLKRTLNPYYQLDRHPWAIMAGVIALGYVAGQWRRNGSRARGNGHLFRETGQFFYDLLKKALPRRA